MRLLLAALVFVAACGGGSPPPAAPPPVPENPNVLLATTTSTQDSGLLDVLIPDFERKTGYRVKTTAVGTGAAIALGSRGEADVILVHAPSAELEFMKTGAGEQRRLVMHNDFVVVGPTTDPARVRGLKIIDALRAIAEARSSFISRGDRSGTDILERDLWRRAGITPSGSWYVESGTGMGQTLKIASEKSAYTLTDRATYLANSATLSLEIFVEKDAALLNVYHVIPINPTKFPKVNAEGGRAFAEYLVSHEAQRLIAEFGRDRFGQSLFFADAGKREEELAQER